MASRITPYINKWCYYEYGKDVRNHPYRLDVSEAFGVDNFASSSYDLQQYPLGYTHEWYYLCEIPEYFTPEALEESWSYFERAPEEEQEADPNLGTPYIPGTFQKVTSDGFTDYFLVDKFNFKNEITLIDKQVRWGTFSGGDANNYAEAFLRGIKIIGKPKSNPEVVPNFNARSLEYIKDDRLNTYKFSAILVPNQPGKPNIQIKFIKNDKWKTITMIIFVNINWEYVDGGRQCIDRTLLYSLESKFQVSGNEIIPGVYDDSIMQGAISFTASGPHPSEPVTVIRGIKDSDGNPTQFLTDIQLGTDGQFNTIEFTHGGDTYEIGGITKVVSMDTLWATDIKKNGVAFSLPSFLPSTNQLKQLTYHIQGGGFNAFGFRMLGVSFADILDKVNNGDPNIVYETVNEDGSRVFASDGSLAQTFMIELRPQDTFLKSIYVGVLPDPNKPTVFNLTDIIGYDLSLQTSPRIMPMSRHSGFYEPISRDLLKFRDPYLNIDFTGGITGATGITGGGNIPDETYKIKVLDLTRQANTQFYSKDFSSNDSGFGQIHNFFYHKVNTEDPSTVLELSNESAFKSLYPLINEVGIDYRDFYIFASNWDPGYYRKSIDKSVVQPIIGTRSMKEKKSFFGSKYLKVPQEVTLETFVPNSTPLQPPTDLQESLSVGPKSPIVSSFFQSPRIRIELPNLEVGTFSYQEDDVKIEIFLYIQKRLIEYFEEPVKTVFLKYVNPLYGVGDLTTLDDDVKDYITINILPLYKIKLVELFTQEVRSEEPTDYTTAELDDSAKFSAGLSATDNFSSKFLNTNQFDTRLIYNKRLGYSEKIGFSVTLEKK